MELVPQSSPATVVVREAVIDITGCVMDPAFPMVLTCLLLPCSLPQTGNYANQGVQLAMTFWAVLPWPMYGMPQTIWIGRD